MGSKKKIEIATEEETCEYAPSGGAGQTDESAKSTPTPAAEGESAAASAEAPAPADELADLRGKVEEFKNKFLRAKADFQNFQRRSQQERGEAVRFANADFARSLLSVLDDFERTFEAADGQNATVESVVEGTKEAVGAHIRWCRHTVRPPYEGNFDRFDITYG